MHEPRAAAAEIQGRRPRRRAGARRRDQTRAPSDLTDFERAKVLVRKLQQPSTGGDDMRFQVRSGGNSAVGKISGSLFALVFAGAGLFLFVLIGRPMVDHYASWFWPSTDCTIESSRFVDASGNAEKPSNPYRFEVQY